MILPEVVGNAGMLVDPDNIEAWNTAIDRAMRHRQKWVDLGLEQAKKFTWEKCGVEIWKVYKKIYSE